MRTSSKYFSSAAVAALPGDDFDDPALAEDAPLLELRGVSRVYGDGDDAVFALDEVDLQVGFGEFVAVVGSPRSGKSTCLNILGCLDTPSLGSYRFCGVALETLTSDQVANLRRRYVGFWFSRPGLITRATALENVEQPLFALGLTFLERTQRAMAALARVGLEEFATHTLAELSEPQRHRLALARALATNPAVLLVDDPTLCLDTNARVELLQLLMRLNAELKLTIVIITHRIDTAAFADRIVRLHDGQIVAEGKRVVAAS